MKASYKILKKIGEGEHGSIFLVADTHNKDNPLYAMKKVISNSYTNFNEFELLPNLSHPNIIKVISHQKNQIGYTLYQQYAQQGDLSAFSHKKYGGIVPERILFKWLVQIALSLHYLHNEVRVLHRDVKSKNILVMNNGIIKLADFGTSRQLLKNQQFAMTAVGTPYYLSPQAVGLSKYNSKSDVWGLGCIMFELSTGKKPFQANSLNDLIKRILNEEVQQIPQTYSIEFRQLVRSMLQKNMEKRITIDAILQKSEVRQAFFQLKQQYQSEYKDFIYPFVTDMKTKKYCEREELCRISFNTQSMKTVKNQQKQKTIKLQISDNWHKEPRSSKFPVRSFRKEEEKNPHKKIQHTKYLERSLKSLIDRKNKQKKIT